MTGRARDQISPERAEYRRWFYPAMLIEFIVFDGDRSVLNILGNFLEQNHLALNILVDIVEQNFAGAVINFSGLGNDPLVERIEAGDINTDNPPQGPRAAQKSDNCRQEAQVLQLMF